MKFVQRFIFGLLCCFLLLNCGCVKLDENPSLETMQAFIEKTQNPRATHTFAQYEQFLQAISSEKFVVLPIHEMRDSIRSDKVIIGLRHDVDCHPFNALKMAQLENQYGIRSTQYILATAPYYGQFTNTGIDRYACMDTLYRQLYKLGCEIGIHNDLINIMVNYHLEPYRFNQEEIAFYRSLGIPVYGTASHGSNLAQRSGIANYEIFSDFAQKPYFSHFWKKYPIGEHSLDEFGFDYEAYFIDYNKYFSDSGGNWNLDGGFSQLLAELQQSIPGDRIQILIHPVWWGKEPAFVGNY